MVINAKINNNKKLDGNHRILILYYNNGIKYYSASVKSMKNAKFVRS